MSEQQQLIALLQEVKKVNEEIRDELRTISAFCTPMAVPGLGELSGKKNPGRQPYEIQITGNMIVFKPQNPVLDNQEAMQLMKYSSRTLRRRRADKILPFTKDKGKIFYQYADLLACADAKKSAPKPKKRSPKPNSK